MFRLINTLFAAAIAGIAIPSFANAQIFLPPPAPPLAFPAPGMIPLPPVFNPDPGAPIFQPPVVGGPIFPGARYPLPPIHNRILTPDGQRIAACLRATGGNVWVCGAVEAGNEFAKCSNGIGVPGGCFGPNGEIMKHGRNAIKDITRGPGDSNDLVGKDGWLRRTFGF